MLPLFHGAMEIDRYLAEGARTAFEGAPAEALPETVA
jgi:hypothetical protein